MALLQEDLRQAGIDRAWMDRIVYRSMAENLNAFERGLNRGSAVFRARRRRSFGLGEVSPVVCREHAWPHHLHGFRHDPGPAFVGDAEALLRMVRAIQRTQQWIYARSAPEIAATISSYFPALDRGVLAAALARFQAEAVWGRDPVLPEGGFDCLRRCLVSGGFIRRPTAFAACVDNRLALQVLTE